ncbi:glycosyltransferase family 2 protein [Marinibacterium profundimaris]|uniref:glycosyltransferase family 2 protein n=1 Tax=Marinibacterium profundimaris TaxID=1679460 RepID=UPI000B521E6B|nr:glycosyltransferase family 2 protein [Marinibacterium profundimaris]
MPEAAANPRVSVITVAYSSFDVLPAMAASLPADVPLITVDNGPDDGVRDWARTQGHTLLEPGRNLGFGAACNLGAEAAGTDFLFFLNPDARLEPGAIAALLDAAERHPDSPAFGPAILKESGEIFRVNASRIPARRDRLIPPARPDTEVALHSLNGAAIFARAAPFRAIGGFDPKIFLYYEDDDMTLRLSQRFGPLIYVPTAHVFHASAGSTAPSAALSRFKGYHLARSQVYVMAKHGRSAPYLRGVLNAARRLVSIRNLTRPEKWNDAKGRWRGALSAWRGTDPGP